MTDLATRDVDVMGPVGYLVVEFPGISKMTGEGFAELVDLVDRGLIRVLDLAFVVKHDDGTVQAVDIRDIDGDGELDLAVFEGASSGMIDASDIAESGSVIEPGCAAALLVYENRWAARFTSAVRRSGGELAAAGIIPQDAIVAALDAAESQS
jgi:hypothetical protein